MNHINGHNGTTTNGTKHVNGVYFPTYAAEVNMATKIAGDMFTKVAESEDLASHKVTIVGAGQVGMACAFSLLTQGVTNEVALVDFQEKKLLGELLDLQHGSLFLSGAKITAGSDYSISSNSKICVVTAGARQKEGESRLDLLQRNTEIFKSIIPKLVEYSPDTILLIVTNPVDILTYVAWKISGLPKNRVIGSGTSLDSSRFRFLISQKLGVNVRNCHGWIIGEHGDSSVPVWSAVNVAGVRLADMVPNIGSKEDCDNWNQVHKEVVESAYKIIQLKGYTSWAIGLSVANLCRQFLSNRQSIQAVSTLLTGQYGITEEVFLSVPCVVGASGVSHLMKLKLSPEEEKQMKDSAKTIHETQQKITL